MMTSIGVSTFALAFVLASFGSPRIAFSQETPRRSLTPVESSTPAASTAPAGVDISKLTPEQQAALQQAIVKLSQNPVGNIAVVASRGLCCIRSNAESIYSNSSSKICRIPLLNSSYVLYRYRRCVVAP